MFFNHHNSQSTYVRPLVTLPSCKRTRITFRQLFFAIFLNVLLLAGNILGNWPTKAPFAFAANRPPSPPASMTLQQFLQQGKRDKAYHGPLVYPRNTPAPKSLHSQTPNYAQLPSSAEPPSMKPLTITLSTAFLAASANAQPIDLVGSDHRLEVQIPPGSLDLSHATIPSGMAPGGPLTFTLLQLHGHFAASMNVLGSYEIQVTDSHGKIISGLRLKVPITFIYHYQVSELIGLDLDPNRLFMIWSDLIASAKTTKQPSTGMVIALHNNTHAHTLTGVSRVIDNARRFDMGGGDPQN